MKVIQMWWPFIPTTHTFTITVATQFKSILAVLWKWLWHIKHTHTHTKQKMTHLHVKLSETHGDWNQSALKIYFIKNRSQLKIAKLNMATVTGNKKKQKKKEIKMHFASTLKFPEHSNHSHYCFLLFLHENDIIWWQAWTELCSWWWSSMKTSSKTLRWMFHVVKWRLNMW